MPFTNPHQESTPGIERTFADMATPCEKITSKREMKRHIIRRAKDFGFNLFVHSSFGYDELVVRTRIKHALRYGNTPTTKYLVISRRFVRNLYRIYRNWPELGEFFLKAALCHEHKHLQQDIDPKQNSGDREAEANRFMIQQTGRYGLIVSLWYYLHRDTETHWTRILNKKPTLSQKKKRILECMEVIYHDLIPPGLYTAVMEHVLLLEEEYQHRLNNPFFPSRIRALLLRIKAVILMFS